MKRPFAFCLAFFLLYISPAFAATMDDGRASLFFTPSELIVIRQAASFRQPIPETTHDAVHLGAIFYKEPDQWLLWLQGERWTPETEKPYLRVLNVTPYDVQLLVTAPQTGITKEITLLPHQTYRPSTGEIFEGYGVP